MANVQDGPEKAERVDRVRRTLLRAGWMVPIVLSLKIPLDALAQYKAVEAKK